MSSVAERLTVWSALAIIMLVVSAWMLAGSWPRWRAARRSLPAGSGIWWVHLTLVGKDGIMTTVWLAVVATGILGFLPALAEYRSWSMLAVVVALAAHQVWSAFGWGRVRRLSNGGDADG